MAKCPECGADRMCKAVFDECLALEFSDPVAGSVHHLTVTCYMIQHNGYSDAALKYMTKMLSDFLEGGISPQRMRELNRDIVNSNQRDWKITGRPSQPLPPDWPLHISDLEWSSSADYCLKITQWAWSVLEKMKTTAYATA